jgi:MFS family permease
VRPALRHRDFRLLWLGQSISLIGDNITAIALALYVTQSTGSASKLALVLAANKLPLVGLILIGGVWADRLPRRMIMIAADVARMALFGALGVIVLAGDPSLGVLMALVAAAGAAAAFFQPAYSGILPQTVPDDDLQAANALTGASRNVAELAGPALATALVLGVGAGEAFLVDAATFAASALFLVPVHARQRGEPQARESLRVELAVGFHEVRSRPWVWVTIASFSFGLFTALAPFDALGALVAEDKYGSAGWFGVLAALFGLGTVAGAVGAFRLRPRHPMRGAMIATLPWPFVVIGFAAGVPLWILCPAVVISGLGFALFDIWWITALAQRIPPHALSRVSSFDWMGSLALMPLGFIVAGAAASAWGAATVVGVGGALGLVAFGLALTSSDLRRLEAVG